MARNRIRQTLAQCLEAAGEIQRRHFTALSAEQMSSKSAEFDIVTVADTESEQAILEIITPSSPKSAAGSTGPGPRCAG